MTQTLIKVDIKNFEIDLLSPKIGFLSFEIVLLSLKISMLEYFEKIIGSGPVARLRPSHRRITILSFDCLINQPFIY